MNWINRTIEDAKFNQALELGCGDSDDTGVLKQFTKYLVSCDIRLDRLINNAKHFEDVCYINFDHSHPFPFRDNSFDFCLASLCLHYFDSSTTDKVIEEVARVLKPGGQLLGRVNSINDLNWGAQGFEQIDDDFFRVNGVTKKFYSIETVTELFRNQKIEFIEENSIDKYHLPKEVITFQVRF